MDFGLLTVPLTMAALAFGFVVVTDNQTVVFDQMAVPAFVTGNSGYSPKVIINHIVDEMHDIERQARSGARAREIKLQGSKTPLMVIADYVKVTPLIRVAQDSVGITPFTFRGEIVAHDKDLELVLRGHDSDQRSEYISIKAPATQLPSLIKKTAYEAMRVIDPYILAAYQFKRDFRTRDFTETVSIINRQLSTDDDRYYKWMYNLWGIVLYQQAARAGAIEKFQAALEIDPDFVSPMLNWGVVLARQGDNVQAIEKFKKVVQNRSGRSPAATKAAAYSEWGFSLALMGRPDEAFAKFRQAQMTDPNFADVYSSWAEVLSALGRSEEAAQMSSQALKLAPQEVVYTENLIGSVQNLPAMASTVN